MFDNVERHKKLLLEELQILDGLEEERALCVEKFRKEKVVGDLERVTLSKEVSWRQKSRALWLREGKKMHKILLSSTQFK